MNKKILLTFLFVIILLLLPVNSVYSIPIKEEINYQEICRSSENLWAVLITVGDPESDGKNAGDLYDILINHGWDESNIYYLREEESTKEAVLSISDWLNTQGVAEGDMVLFYFSMHGGRKDDVPPLDEPDNLDEYVVPFKTESEESNILDEELAIMFDEINTEKLVIIFETCYSGGMIDGANDLKKSGRIVITSTRKDETSYGLFLIKSWLFPYYLIKGLRGSADKNHDGYISAEELFEYAKIRTILRSTVYGLLLFIFHKSLLNQHPQIYDGWPSEENNDEELKLLYIN